MEIIVSAAASFIVQYIKMKFKTSEYQTLGALAVTSLVVAALYTTIVAAGYWETVANVLVSASAIYTLLIARFEK